MNNQFDDIIRQIASEHGVSPAQVRGDMMEAIHAAYTNDDPDAKQRFQMVFGDKEPSIEEFVQEIAKLLGPSSELKH